MIRCGQCGARHPANTLFCDECGSRLSAEAADNRPPQPAPGQDLLAVELSTPDGQTCYRVLLDREVLIGRRDDPRSTRPEVNLAGGDKERGVSRRHARLLREGKSVLIEDLNSLNGTYWKGMRLPAHAPQAVEPGDELQFATIVLRVQF